MTVHLLINSDLFLIAITVVNILLMTYLRFNFFGAIGILFIFKAAILSKNGITATYSDHLHEYNELFFKKMYILGYNCTIISLCVIFIILIILCILHIKFNIKPNTKHKTFAKLEEIKKEKNDVNR